MPPIRQNVFDKQLADEQADDRQRRWTNEQLGLGAVGVGYPMGWPYLNVYP